MPNAFVCYPDPQKRDLAVKLVNGLGNVFSPSAGVFVASDPADAKIPLFEVTAADLSAYQVAVVPALPADSGPVLAFVVPAAGGPAVDEPIPVVAADTVTPFGVAFQV